MEYKLNSVYPNPFNPVTNIKFFQPNNSKTKIQIFNIRGELVSTLLNQNINKGSHIINWNANNLSSGIYFINLENSEYKYTGKLILSK